MKKILFLAATAFIFQACEGPMGPPGPPGEDGLDGLIGEVHEVRASFNASNNYSAGFDFQGSAIEESDKIVGFILDREDSQGNDVWEPLPQTFFSNGETFLFTFHFSRTGFTLFMDGSSNLSSVPSATRTDRWFRMMIVPAYLVGKVDINNMQDIMSKMGVQESDVKMIH